jgi:hypothetical protein
MAANGYIGKISAIVTANTSAFSRQLANAGKSVNAFENTLNSSLTRASNNAQGSLQKIFTQFQQLEGRLKTAVDLNLRTDGQAGAIRAITQVAEQLNRPLERAQKQFSALSLEAAAGFAPALERVQDSVVAVNKATVRTGQIAESSFSAATAEVQRTTQALARLAQAEQLAGQGLTGNELQFADPRLFQTLQANARTTATAGALPVSALENGDVARQTRQIKQYENAAIEARATVENLRLDPQVNPEVILAAERRLQQLTETARRAGAQLAATVEAASPAAAIARANEQLALVADQPPPPPPRTDLGDRLAQAGRSRIERLTGNVNLDSTPTPGVFNQQAQRDIDALANRVGAVRQQLETLPNSVRTRFIPELQRAQAQLVRLQNAPLATAEAIENAARRVERLEASARRAQAALNFRQSFGGAGLRGIEEGLNQQALQGYNAQLQLLQQTLAGTSQAARGPAVAAFNNLRNAIANAMERGTLETEQTRRALQRLTQEAVRATAAAAGIGERGLARRLQRVGDIGRGAFGNLGLGVQQAVFAVDDFFSVTGGLEQRIRAAGNNISQLGFVLGGTAGLIAGVAVSLGAQAAVALIKFANSGRGAEDQAKALNAALEKQKSIVDELKSSFESLAGSLADGVFSSANRSLRIFGEEIRRLQQDQQKARGDLAAARDPRTARIGADVSVIDRALQSETNPVRAQILARRRQELQDSSARVRGQVAGTPAPGSQQISEFVRGVGQALLRFSDQNRGSPFRDRTLQARGVQISRLGDDVPAGRSISARAEQLRRLRETEGQLAGVLDAPRGQFGLSAIADFSAALEQTQRQIALVDRELSEAVDAQAISSLRVIQRAGDAISQNVQSLEDAVSAGITGAASALDAQEDLGEQLRDARDRLTAAFGIEDSAERGKAVEASRREITQIDAAVQARAGEIAAIKTVRGGVQAFVLAVEAASGQLAESAAQDARSRSDQTRRQANLLQGRAASGLALPRDVDFAARQRDEARLASQDIEARAAAIRAQQIRLRGIFERDASSGQLGVNLQQLIQRRGQAQAVLDDRGSSPRARVSAEAALEQINQRLQRSFEALPGVQRLGELSDELDAAAQGAAAFADAIEEGRKLVLTDGQKAADEFIAQVQQLNAALKNEEITEEQRKKAIARLREDSLRGLAPGAFALFDSVRNAVAQGPSRAALNASDISTSEGARELNRLIRGDDAARNQDLVQLQKEGNALLDRIARGVENNEAKVAN